MEIDSSRISPRPAPRVNVSTTTQPLAVSDPTRFCVGDLIVDVGRRRVTRAGVDLKVPGLSFELLTALVRAAPNVVPVRRLMDIVWPHAVVSRRLSAKRVKLLRSALGDDANSPRYLVEFEVEATGSSRLWPRSVPSYRYQMWPRQ